LEQLALIGVHFVFCLFYDCKINALIDTGANCSCISLATATKLKLSLLPLLVGESHTLFAANGTNLEIVGKLELPINIKGLIIPYIFFSILKNLHHALLLGIDFLKATKTKIDWEVTPYHFAMILSQPLLPLKSCQSHS
jgi:predicted aspartyl protease